MWRKKKISEMCWGLMYKNWNENEHFEIRKSRCWTTKLKRKQRNWKENNEIEKRENDFVELDHFKGTITVSLQLSQKLLTGQSKKISSYKGSLFKKSLKLFWLKIWDEFDFSYKKLLNTTRKVAVATPHGL